MKVGDLVFIKKGAVQADWHYGVGVILEIKHFPSEGGFISHKVMWSQDLCLMLET